MLIAIQFAANHEAELDVSDALAVVVALISEALAGLDRLEAASSKVLGIPVEELLGMRKPHVLAKHRLSPAGMRHAERFQQLRKTEQRFVKKIIELLMEKRAPLTV